MNRRLAFALDCNPIIPECGFKCEKCIKEMESVFGKIKGVSKFYREGDGVVVEYDSAMVTVAQLIDVFKGLPSFYKGFFIPTVIGNPEKQD
jgi:copper chaperone CopZ